MIRRATWGVPAVVLAALVLAPTAQADWVRQTWGAKAFHADTLTVVGAGATSRIVFNLSAIPRGATVHRALLRNHRVRQPARPIRIFVVEGLEGDKPAVGAKALALVPPRNQWFDATEAVRAWVKRPKSNLGLSLAAAGGFDPKEAFLDIWYDGRRKDVPDGVTGLKAVHRDGQTFLTWDELPMYRPAPKDVVWAMHDKRPWHYVDGPGKGYMGKPRVAGIKQATLRKIQRFKVINATTRSMSRQRPRLVRTGPWPDVYYRVYRSREKITPGSIHRAEWIGDTRPLCEYDMSMVRIVTWGEYYDPREDPEGFIPTYCLADGRSLPPGRAFFVHTPTASGRWHYAVTVWRDGVENFKVAPGAASLAEPVAEKTAPLKPILQFPRVAWGTVLYKYYLWEGPPLTAAATAGINRISVYVHPKRVEPGWLSVIRFAPANVHDKSNVMMRLDFGNGIGYSQGRGSFLSLAESKVDYYDERSISRLIDWVRKEWKIDPSHGIVSEGQYVPPMYAVRNPDRIRYLHTQASRLGYDWLWRPEACPLGRLLGPRDSARTVDNLPAWEQWHLGYYLRDPSRDLPFFYWKEQQEGPQISFLAIAALRDARQPFASEWGGGRLSRQLRHMLRRMRWDRSVPAFAHCSLDANPGSGWRPDGDPRGQINGYLVWDYDTVAESPDRWEMAVGLSPEAPRDDCTVDLTPRHCRAFKPKAGDVFRWTNTDLASGREVQAGQVTADRWGLVTLKSVKVSKGATDQAGRAAKCQNLIRISRGAKGSPTGSGRREVR